MKVKNQFKEMRISSGPNGRYTLTVDGKPMPRSLSWHELMAEVKRLEEIAILSPDKGGRK